LNKENRARKIEQEMETKSEFLFYLQTLSAQYKYERKHQGKIEKKEKFFFLFFLKYLSYFK
jgi:hypothetical protein